MVWEGTLRAQTQSSSYTDATCQAKEMKDVTYGKFVCTIRPEKKETQQTRFVVGGNKINYPGEVATLTAEKLDAKLLFSSIISTHGA